jgi:replicative DNA helicase
MLAGLQPSDLLILAARPSVGKTALAVDIMRSVVKSGAAVFFASLEMSGNQQAQRTLAAEGRVDANALRSGRMSEEDWRAITAAQERLHDGICIVDDDANKTPGSLGAACRRMKQKHALDLVIVDYLQLMNGGGGRRYENRNVEVSYISRSLKLLAKELGAPVLALSQLSRDIDKRADPRPQLSDLRDSGSLEQDADVVMFLHRELTEQEEKDLPKDAPVPTIVSVRKQRMGPTGDVKLGFVRRFARYDNWMEREQR